VKIIVPGTPIELDNCKVYILNVVSAINLLNQKRYLVSCVVECYGKKSKPFFIDVGSNEELIRTLKYEISLFKLLVLGGSYDIYREK